MTPLRTAHLRLEPIAPDTTILWLDVADRPVNVLNRAVLADLDAVFTQLAADRSCRILVLRSAKPSGFIAGADLHDFAAIAGSGEAIALSEQGQLLFGKLAMLPQTTVAVIGGACLGGGLECALACDYRWVIDSPKTQLGLPELELGLLPGWGGTQRLPRVIGLEAALKMILGTRRLKAHEAVRWGLAQALLSEATLESDLAEHLDQLRRAGGKTQRNGLPLRGWRQRLIESNTVGRYLIWRGTEATLRQRVPDDMPAPWEALQAVRVGVERGLEAGLAAERAAVGRLAVTPACHNLVSLFFQREDARKLPAELRTVTVPPVRKVGIVGAGTMGAGIAQLAAVQGFEVVVQEVNDAALAAGVAKIDALFRKAVDNRVVSAEDAAKRSATIRRTTTWDGFADVDMAVEAVIEDLEAKRAVFHELEQRTRPNAVLATNTSSLLVAGLQSDREHPQRIGGLHFFNPVHKMPLVEVVRGPHTDAATAATLTRWATDLGKTPVVVKDSPGFLVNRILTPYLVEAVGLLTEASLVGHIDRLMRRFGMPMGPLELLDQIGLDIALQVQKTLEPVLGERLGPGRSFAQFAEKGWLGQKSGQGFYRYDGPRKKLNPELAAELQQNAFAANGQTDAMYRDRMVLLMVNEAVLCLAEGIAPDAATIDLAMVFGTGWAPHRGGPLRYADDRGLAEVVGVLTELSKSVGPRFAPCADLRRRAEAGDSFYPPPHGAGGERALLAGAAGE